MSEAGGTEWELSTALDMALAGRAAGDEAAERLGWIRFSEGLRNVVQSAVASQIVNLTIQLRKVRDQHKEDEAAQAHVNLLITALEEAVQAEQGKQAARLGMIEAAQTTADHKLKEHIAAGDEEAMGHIADR
jgi:hypothetical protein